MENYNVALVLRDAADLIERNGLIAGSQVSSDGRHCAIGAINACIDSPDYAGKGSLRLQAAHAIVQTLFLELESDQYNDHALVHPDSVELFMVAAWSNRCCDAGSPQEVIDGLRLAAAWAD